MSLGKHIYKNKTRQFSHQTFFKSFFPKFVVVLHFHLHSFSRNYIAFEWMIKFIPWHVLNPLLKIKRKSKLQNHLTPTPGSKLREMSLFLYFRVSIVVSTMYYLSSLSLCLIDWCEGDQVELNLQTTSQPKLNRKLNQQKASGKTGRTQDW